MSAPPKDSRMIGEQFGKWVVISEPFRKMSRQIRWAVLVRCTCGLEKELFTVNLKNAKGCRSCAQEEAAKAKTVHGDSTNSKSKSSTEYKTWMSMRARCNNPNDSGYKRYGARGITVCSEWEESYETFLSDIGRKPSPEYSIDRIDNNKGYSKENCRWAKKKEQGNNRCGTVFLIYNGTTRTMSEWAENLGIPYYLLKSRRRCGWSIERMFEMPVKQRKYKKCLPV